MMKNFPKEITAVGIWYFGILACYLFYGIFAGFLTTGLGIMLMENTEQEFMSRINTIFTAIGESIVPVASLITGLFLKIFEISLVFILVAIGIFVFLLGGVFFHRTLKVKKHLSSN